MAQSNIATQVQLLLEKAKKRDEKAIEELLNITSQSLERDSSPDALNEFAISILKEKPTLGFELLTLASELGNLQATHTLAICFMKGTGTTININEAIRLLKACYEAGDESSLRGLNVLAAQLQSGNNVGIPKDLEKSIELFVFVAQKGYQGAIENLARLGGWFYKGLFSCPKDLTRGIELLKIAAKLGNEGALNNLVGIGAEILKEDPKLSVELFTWANDELGSVKAKRNLAVCLLRGTGISPDSDRAIQLLKACYQAGDKSILKDLHSIALEFVSGSDKGIKQDIERAVELLTFAAQERYEDAIENLARLGGGFYKGVSSCPKDLTRGIELLKIAAKLGNEGALNNLVGIGAEILKEDPKLSVELFTWANDELGSVKAKRNLAICLLRGTGISPDTDRAIQLLKACYQAGDKSILKDLDSIALEFFSGSDKGIKQDIKRAVELLTFAAQEGCQEAIEDLSLPQVQPFILTPYQNGPPLQQLLTPDQPQQQAQQLTQPGKNTERSDKSLCKGQ